MFKPKRASLLYSNKRTSNFTRTIKHPAVTIPLATFAGLLMLSVLAIVVLSVTGKSGIQATSTRTAIVSHDGQEQTIPTRAQTVGDVLDRLDIRLGEGDVVEPGQDARIATDNFRINVYRGTPVTIVDGERKTFTFSAAATPRSVVKQAGIEVHPEDLLENIPTDNFLLEGSIGPRVVITRATSVHVNLYGTQVTMRTQAKTVGEMLKEHNINLGEGESVEPSQDTPISEDMQILLLQQGARLAEVSEEEIPMPVEEVKDDSLSIGARAVRQEGSPGRQFTYVIEIGDGPEAERKQIQFVVEPAVKQIVAIGTRSVGGLTKARGVYYFTDSNGVTHRETWYDLPMNGVMRNNSCGTDGSYSVRADDGAKLDQEGYILVAANLNIYPRCSIIETSLGLGRVYDTGGFALRHPHGFDLATDWSNYDGR